MIEAEWLTKREILVIHAEQIAVFGGLMGLRDEGLLESALARPLQYANYSDPTIVQLGALYAVSIIRNHPFFDGNKRTGFLSMFTFLQRNGIKLRASQAEATAAMLDVAEGLIDVDGLAAWLADYTQPLE